MFTSEQTANAPLLWARYSLSLRCLCQGIFATNWSCNSFVHDVDSQSCRGNQHLNIFLFPGSRRKHLVEARLRCNPEMQADSKARQRERASRAHASSPQTTVFDEQRGVKECDARLQTHTQTPVVQSASNALFAGTTTWMLFINLTVYSGWQAHLEFPCQFDLLCNSPCLGIVTVRCNFKGTLWAPPGIRGRNCAVSWLRPHHFPKLQTIWTPSQSRLKWGRLRTSGGGCWGVWARVGGGGGGQGPTELCLFWVNGLTWIGSGGSGLEPVCLEKFDGRDKEKKRCHFQGGRHGGAVQTHLWSNKEGLFPKKLQCQSKSGLWLTVFDFLPLMDLFVLISSDRADDDESTTWHDAQYVKLSWHSDAGLHPLQFSLWELVLSIRCASV